MKQNTVVNQIFKILSRREFQRHVRKFDADKGVKHFTTWRQFKVLLYAQIRQLGSLREIVSSLQCHSRKLYHLGLSAVSRSTLADANKRRDWQCFQAMFYTLLGECRRLAPRHRLPLKRKLYSLDATVLSLSLSLFPWARFRKRKGGIKVHTLLDHSGHLPSFLAISDAATHDVKIAADPAVGLQSALPADSIVVMDKAYIDFDWLQTLDTSSVTFVTRAKTNLRYRIVRRLPKRRKAGVFADHIVRLTGAQSRKKYPGDLRLVKFRDKESGRDFVFLTNNTDLAATTIAQCYKQRWQIELFFKWIKQHLKIKTFIGNSPNAVLTQIWVAMIYYLLLSYLKFLSKSKYSMLELARMFRELALEFRDMYSMLLPNTRDPVEEQPTNQLALL